MFREMRRKNQLMPNEETIALLRQCTSGVLALSGDDGYPYALPISYAYEDGKLFFHSAVTGHKIDAIRSCDKASFCVISQDDIVPERFTTHYRSVVAFGKIRILEDPQEILSAIRVIADKYSPNVDVSLREKEIEGSLNRMSVIALEIEHLTGKEARELSTARNK